MPDDKFFDTETKAVLFMGTTLIVLVLGFFIICFAFSAVKRSAQMSCTNQCEAHGQPVIECSYSCGLIGSMRTETGAVTSKLTPEQIKYNDQRIKSALNVSTNIVVNHGRDSWDVQIPIFFLFMLIWVLFAFRPFSR